MTDWNEWFGHDAYRALACEHFPEFGQQLREDLRTDFASAGQKYYEGELITWKEIAARRTTTSNQTSSFPSMSGSWSALWNLAQQPDESTPESSAQSSVESRKAYYIAAALAGLGRNGAGEDVNFGRRFLFHSDEDVRIEAVKVIGRCGSPQDVPDLIKVATSKDGLLQELAARDALNLSDEPLTVAGQFLATGDEILISLTITELIALEDKESTAEFLTPYLYDVSDKIRTRVIAFFGLRFGKEELEPISIEYMSKEIYYYDVVCYLDRFLYSPPHQALAYLRALKESFFGFLEESVSVSALPAT